MSGILNALVGSYAPVGGSFESIATITGNSTTDSIGFFGIPNTYRHLQLRMTGKGSAGGSGVRGIRIDLNSDLNTNYAQHALTGDGSSVAASGTGNANLTTVYSFVPDASPVGTVGVAIFDIADYQSTTKNKTIRMISGFDANGTGRVTVGSGLWMSTSPVNSITISNLAGSLWTSASTFALYGIKGE